MPEITIKGKSLTEVEQAVYMPIVFRAVKSDSRTTEADVKKQLNESGLALSDERIAVMLEYARIRNGFAMATRLQ